MSSVLEYRCKLNFIVINEQGQGLRFLENLAIVISPLFGYGQHNDIEFLEVIAQTLMHVVCYVIQLLCLGLNGSLIAHLIQQILV